MPLIHNSVLAFVFSLFLASIPASSASAWHLFPFFGHQDHKVTISNDLPPGCATTIVWCSSAQKKHGGVCFTKRLKTEQSASYEYTPEQRQGTMTIMALIETPVFPDKMQVAKRVVKGKHQTISLSRIVPPFPGEYVDKEKVFAHLDRCMA